MGEGEERAQEMKEEYLCPCAKRQFFHVETYYRMGGHSSAQYTRGRICYAFFGIVPTLRHIPTLLFHQEKALCFFTKQLETRSLTDLP